MNTKGLRLKETFRREAASRVPAHAQTQLIKNTFRTDKHSKVIENILNLRSYKQYIERMITLNIFVIYLLLPKFKKEKSKQNKIVYVLYF